MKWGTGTVKLSVGKNIKVQRTQRGWSQQDLATQLLMTRQTISKWELGRSYPDLESLVRLSQLFDVTTDALLGLTPPKPKQSFFSVLFHRGSTDNMKAVKWYAGGHDRAEVALGLITDLVANLDDQHDQPLRELLASYYKELIDQRSGSNLYVITRMGIGLSKCLHQNEIVLDEDNERRLKALLELNNVRYM